MLAADRCAGASVVDPPRGPVTASGEGALGKHEELPALPGGYCTCGPKHLRLRSNHGELVEVRGGCVNQCDYCAKLAAVENCEMLCLDAEQGNAPRVLTILSTRTATLDMEVFSAGRESMVRGVKRRFPQAEYAYEVEFTTGYGPRSGGLRRPHWNYFWKGIPVEQLAEFAEIVIRLWCKHVDAEPQAQYVAEIDNAIGLTKYVCEHFMKASQRPPEGFTGQRFNCSRGYFGVDAETGVAITVTMARRRAKESLRAKREVWKARNRGFDAYDAELIAHEALELAASTVWVLTNERGAQLSPTIHDERRMVLAPGRRVRSLPARVERIVAGVEPLQLFRIHDGVGLRL